MIACTPLRAVRLQNEGSWFHRTVAAFMYPTNQSVAILAQTSLAGTKPPPYSSQGLGCGFERLRRLLAAGLEKLQAAKQLLIGEAFVPSDIVTMDWDLALQMQADYIFVGWPQLSVDWLQADFNEGIVTMDERMVQDIADFNAGIVTMDEDIAAELLSKATQGLSVVRSTIRTAEWLRKQLISVIETLSLFTSTKADQHQHWRNDDLELRSANALRHVDQLLLRQMPVDAQKELKMLQTILQDVALLACSRGVDETILRTKGIQPQLLDRLEASFQGALTNGLWSRLGNSKYHCFTEGVSFGKRKHRRGRATRNYLSSLVHGSSASSGHPAVSPLTVASSSPADIGQPPPSDLGEPIHVHSQAIAPPGLPPPSDLGEPIFVHCGIQEKIADVLNMHKVCDEALLGDIMKTIPR